MADDEPAGPGDQLTDDAEEESSNSIPSFSEFAPDAVVAFANNPRNFVLGAVLTALLEGLFSVVTTLLEAIQLVFVGDSITTTEGAWGIADIPLGVAELLAGVGGEAGETVIGAIAAANDPLFTAAQTAGPLAPVLVVGVIVIEVLVLLFVGDRLLRVILDIVPGAGGLL